MKKINKFITMLIALFFVGLPLASLSVNHISKKLMDKDMLNLVDNISKDKIQVLEIEGRKTSAGMFYVQNAWKNINVINLHMTPGEMTIHNDTLRVILDDDSDVYQGAIMIGDLQYVIRNGETTKLKEF